MIKISLLADDATSKPISGDDYVIMSNSDDGGLTWNVSKKIKVSELFAFAGLGTGTPFAFPRYDSSGLLADSGMTESEPGVSILGDGFGIGTEAHSNRSLNIKGETNDDTQQAIYAENLGGTYIFWLENSGLLYLMNGEGVDEFSSDGTLAGNSDTAVPTEQAVKTYVDASGGGSAISESTGVKTGGVMSTGTASDEYSITDGTGQVVDSLGAMTSVVWSGKTNITPTNIASQLITFVGINSSGNVVEQAARFTNLQSRTIIPLGVAIHVNMSTVDAVNNEQHVAYNVGSQLHDLFEAIGFFNVSGNVFGANGANLNIDKSVGVMFAAGSNYSNDINNPHPVTLAALSVARIQYRFSDGTNGDASASITAFASGSNTTVTSNAHGRTEGDEVVITGTTSYDGTFNITSVTTNTYDISATFVADDATGAWDFEGYTIAIDPANLDDGAGGLTALSGNNKWAATRINSFTSNNVKAQRGVEEFGSKDKAIAGISSEAFITEPSIAANGLFRGWLVHRKDATDLSDDGKAVFIEAPKFQSSVGGVGLGASSYQVILSDYLIGSTSGPTTTVTTSGTAVVIAEMTKTFTPASATNKIKVQCSCTFSNTVDQEARMGIFIDGVLEAETEAHEYAKGASFHGSIHVFWRGTLSAASHTISVRMWTTGGTLTAVGVLRNMEVEEIAE